MPSPNRHEDRLLLKPEHKAALQNGKHVKLSAIIPKFIHEDADPNSEETRQKIDVYLYALVLVCAGFGRTCTYHTLLSTEQREIGTYGRHLVAEVLLGMGTSPGYLNGQPVPYPKKTDEPPALELSASYRKIMDPRWAPEELLAAKALRLRAAGLARWALRGSTGTRGQQCAPVQIRKDSHLKAKHRAADLGKTVGGYVSDLIDADNKSPKQGE